MSRHHVSVREPMTHPCDYLPILDRFGVALESACDALITLESIDVLPIMDSDTRAERHIAQAISHLQQAIEQVREAQAQGQTGLALGFVLARDRHSSGEDGQTDQSSPRRTA
jgi:hypothetical protein